MDILLVPNQSETGKYNMISVCFNKVSKRFICVYIERLLRAGFWMAIAPHDALLPTVPVARKAIIASSRAAFFPSGVPKTVMPLGIMGPN